MRRDQDPLLGRDRGIRSRISVISDPNPPLSIPAVTYGPWPHLVDVSRLIAWMTAGRLCELGAGRSAAADGERC